jgi:hypothetical protein
MKLPNWAKIGWWCVLTFSLTCLLSYRLAAFQTGSATAADLVVAVVWVALLLSPLFSEVTMLGVTLKSELKDLKSEVSGQLNHIRSEIKNAVDVRTTFNPQIYMNAPSDAELPNIEKLVNEAIKNALASDQSTSPEVLVHQEDVVIDANTQFLFSSRYNIEKEVRRMSEAAGLPSKRPLNFLLRELTKMHTIPADLANALVEVQMVTNPAVHGEPVSDAQVAFVRDVTPGLISALKKLG